MLEKKKEKTHDYILSHLLFLFIGTLAFCQIVLINMTFLRFMSVNQGQFIPVLETLDSVSRDSIHYFHFKLTYFNIYTEI